MMLADQLRLLAVYVAPLEPPHKEWSKLCREAADALEAENALGARLARYVFPTDQFPLHELTEIEAAYRARGWLKEKK